VADKDVDLRHGKPPSCGRIIDRRTLHIKPFVPLDKHFTVSRDRARSHLRITGAEVPHRPANPYPAGS
jgi:hypothetical protein